MPEQPQPELLPGELTDPFHSLTPETEKWFQHILLQLPPNKDWDYLKVLPTTYGPWLCLNRVHTALRVLGTLRTLETRDMAAMRLACALALRIELDAPMYRYGAHLCATASVKRLLEACNEVHKYNTLTLPDDFKDPLF